jgi:hypothetical protein
MKINKYKVETYCFLEAVGVWVDYDFGQMSIHQVYDHLNKLFDIMNYQYCNVSLNKVEK